MLKQRNMQNCKPTPQAPGFNSVATVANSDILLCIFESHQSFFNRMNFSFSKERYLPCHPASKDLSSVVHPTFKTDYCSYGTVLQCIAKWCRHCNCCPSTAKHMETTLTQKS
jgi:hypothetical protein